MAHGRSSRAFESDLVEHLTPSPGFFFGAARLQLAVDSLQSKSRQRSNDPSVQGRYWLERANSL